MMCNVYDNWERLVAATLRREDIWQMFHEDSVTPSARSEASDFSISLQRSSSFAELRQIIRPENPNAGNQLTPEDIFVNGRALTRRELTVLQSCPNPPKKLKPGYYWYDKGSGFWGKQGQKPSQIVNPQLDVGDFIHANASNGNTQVFVNNREITKVELRLFQFAGIRCHRELSLWMNADGSLQEEGSKYIRGYLWGKVGIKLLCSLLSLPFPFKSFHSGQQKALPKLLLTGIRGSGTRTIFNQAKILYKDVPFSKDERRHIKLSIQNNLWRYLVLLLKGREHFEEECLNGSKKNQSSGGKNRGQEGINGEHTAYSISPRLKELSNRLLEVIGSASWETRFPAASWTYLPLFMELWGNAAIQSTYMRRSELETLPSNASYFLEQAVDILKLDYEPSYTDILCAEGVSSSFDLSTVDFSFPEPVDHNDAHSGDSLVSLLRFHPSRSSVEDLEENLKRLEMFERVQFVIFCVSLIDYDQFVSDSNGNVVNKMRLNRTFFKRIVTCPTFHQIDFLLLLTKFDLFEKKIEQVPLGTCGWFDDFLPVNHIPSLAQLGFHYIAVKFRNLYSALTGRKLYVSSVNCLENKSVDAALKYVSHVMKWKKEESEYFIDYSTDETSYSDSDGDE